MYLFFANSWTITYIELHSTQTKEIEKEAIITASFFVYTYMEQSIENHSTQLRAPSFKYGYIYLYCNSP